MDGMHLRPGRPLLADSARQRAGVLLAGCVVLIGVLGVLFAHQAQADWLDHAIDSPIITWLGRYQGLAPRLAAPGSLTPAGALSAAIVVACLLGRRLNGALLAATAVPATTGLNDGLFKPLVHRTYLGVLSYPSGHTAAISALAATVAVLLLVPPQATRTGPCGCCWRVRRACWDAWLLPESSACDGTTSLIPWPAPLSALARSAGSRSFWTCPSSGGNWRGHAISRRRLRKGRAQPKASV